MKKFVFALMPLVFAAAAPAQPAAEIVSGAGDRQATSITVYNDDLALVRERRRVSLPSGPVRLSLREVSAKMRPETALLRTAAGEPLGLVEQNFDFDLLTPAKLLEKYVGREVTVLRPIGASGEERRETATVLAASGGVVLRFADRIETGIPGRIVYDSVPPNLRDLPTLSILLERQAGGVREIELSYLTGGLSWSADYVASLAADGRRMDLSGWITLTNRSGTTFENATMQFVAGSLNRVRAPALPRGAATMSLAARAAPADMAQEALLDYHLYSHDRPTSIADNQTKQLALLSAGEIAVRREYRLSGAEHYYRDRVGLIGQKIKPSVFVEFDNKGGQLGRPLPGGIVRVYARDARGAAQFVGEDRIEHTARDETVRLRLGEAFDITADRRQTQWRKLGETTSESTYRIELRNAKDEAVTVRIVEPIPGDWEILQESHRSVRESARSAAWSVSVPAGSSAVLEYTARVRW
ncbi:MAG: hypothetical protein RIS35_368 [Pseudomonadota bacterium]|jgi:hypothetical protein